MRRVFKLGELFAGAGGLAWGALHAESCYGKIVHAWANDYDTFTCDTYRKNICPEEIDSVVSATFSRIYRRLDLTKLKLFPRNHHSG